jgi:GNAT superfamily N-acetyltransferase
MDIKIANTDAEIMACLPVMKELRPALEGSNFIERVRRQMAQGYRLAWLGKRGKPVACMGFREMEHLYTGPSVFIDDLVTTESERGKGCGEALIKWAADYAKSRGCRVLHLDSGTQRHDAHRFYMRERFHIVYYHFALDLSFAP